MKPADQQRLVEIFNGALELPLAERPQFLSSECGADAGLRAEVESLLAFHDDDFLKENVRESVMEVIRGGLLPGHVIEDRYEIIDTLGRGGMGVVYLAQDHKLKRRVAMKALATNFGQDERRVKSVRQEALTLTQLKHDNILTAYDFAEDRGAAFIITEYIDGETLRRKLRAGPLDIKTAVGIARQMALALEAAHGRGFVHRDVKPENVIVQEDGHVKVIDFGIAKLTEPEPGEGDGPGETGVSRAQGASGFGTESYMSWEQARNEPVDHRTDIWSLGVCLYEMLAGVPPFRGEKPIDTAAAIIKEEPRPLGQNVPVELKAIVKRALQKNRGARYQKMLDFRSDLDVFLSWWPDKRPKYTSGRVDTLKGWRRTRGKTIWRGLFLGATLSLLAAVASALIINYFGLFVSEPSDLSGMAAHGAQIVVSVFHLILIAVALRYFYKHPGPNGFRHISNDLQHGGLNPNITDSTGYVRVDDWERARGIAVNALQAYRESFVALLWAWFSLYSVALLIPIVAMLWPFVDKHIVTSFFTQANNINTLCIWLCFRILDEPITTENRAALWIVIRALKVPTGTILFIVLVMFFWFGLEAVLTKTLAGLAQNIHQFSKLLSGICGGVAMALFVGRFQSKFVKSTEESPDKSTNKSTDWVIVIFYLYTVIQTLFFLYGDESVEGKWTAAAVMQSALYLKCLLILYTFWLFQTGRLLFYLVRVRRASDQADSEWLKFREVLGPEG